MRRTRKCVGCGKCCGHYLPLSDEDIMRVKEYAESHNIEPRWTGIDCPWLADNKTCNVYDVRPSICRAYHCESGKAGRMYGNPADYHVYNTERLFIYGDRTSYDALLDLAGAFGALRFDTAFGVQDFGERMREARCGNGPSGSRQQPLTVR